jgi:uncharacterized RDD family membrane protein YckC
MPVGLRRLTAFGIDYLLILVWIALITAVGFLARSRFGVISGEHATTGDKLVGHAVSFVALTLPVVLYFAVAESASRHATLGKRVLGIRVERADGEPVSRRRCLVRSVVKFLPWELAHTVIWHSPGLPFVSAPEPWGVVGYAVALLGAGTYLATVVLGDGRTPYDHVAGTAVRTAPPRSWRYSFDATRVQPN